MYVKHIFSVFCFKTAIGYKLILFYAVYGSFKANKCFLLIQRLLVMLMLNKQITVKIVSQQRCLLDIFVT